MSGAGMPSNETFCPENVTFMQPLTIPDVPNGGTPTRRSGAPTHAGRAAQGGRPTDRKRAEPDWVDGSGGEGGGRFPS